MDPVAAQYEQWIYPSPIWDLSTPEQRGLRDAGDPGFLADAYWPDRHRGEELDILIAGCGTNAAARYAFNHPESKVVGIDISKTSLAHSDYLKDKHGLANLMLVECRIEDVATLGRDFDLIDATGVLHHLPDPTAGLAALRGVLRLEGEVFLGLYGKYGRVGVYMMQELFQLLRLDQSEQSVGIVKDTVAALSGTHHLTNYVKGASDLNFDAGWIDTFLHRQDAAFDVAGCLRLVENAGLVFHGWNENFFYHPDGQIPGGHPLVERLNRLREPELWRAMELLNSTIGMHSFFACRPDRDPASYRIAFDSAAFFDYVPVRRVTSIEVKEGESGRSLVISRPPFPAFPLNGPQSVLFERIDGRSTVRDCLRASGMRGTDSDLMEFARGFFRSLWRIGYIFMRVRP
jgi:SAM-dependent methyltransferase